MRNCAPCPTICMKAGEPPDASCDFISSAKASNGDTMSHRFQHFAWILDEFEWFSFALRSILHFTTTAFNPVICNLVQQTSWFCCFHNVAGNAPMFGRRPRIIHRRGGWWPPTSGWPQIGPIWDPGRAKFAPEELVKRGVVAQLSAEPPATSPLPQQPTTSSQPPATSHQRQAISHQPPATDDEQPATGHEQQLPATSSCGRRQQR